MALDKLCRDAVAYDQECDGETERTAARDQTGHIVGAHLGAPCQQTIYLSRLGRSVL